jgi:hypothetical protein
MAWQECEEAEGGVGKKNVLLLLANRERGKKVIFI